MIIYNEQNIITNKQIEECVQKYEKDLVLNDVKIVVREKRKSIFKVDFLDNAHKTVYFWLNRGCEGGYSIHDNIIFVNLYNIGGSKEDKRLYGIGVLIYEIQHMLGYRKEEECTNRSIRFLNKNSKFLKEILNLKNEYIVEDF